jgi:hypothetical protein
VKNLAATAFALIFVSLLVIATSGSSIAAVSTPALAAGDQLVYEIAIELQQHHLITGARTEDKASESSTQGTETFTIYAIAKDGTAFANVDASFKGVDSGKPFESHTTTTAKVTPDGRLRVKNQFGLGISDAFGFANATTAEFAGHALRLGAAWTTPENTAYARLTLLRRVAGRKTYGGFNTYEVQSLGTGELLKTSDGLPATGTVAVSGTSYYDMKDHLFIGEALRTLTVVQQAGSESAHDNYSATMQVVLSSWAHGAPPSSEPSSQPSSAPANTQPPPQAQYATPAPIQSIYGSTPVPTVTPRLGP